VEGANYGWGPNETCSGSAPENTNQDGPSPTLPELWYDNPFGPTGVAFCDGCSLGADADGDLFFGAVNTGDIRQVELNGTREDATSQSVAYTHTDSVLSMEVGPDGSIYFSDFGGIFRLRSS
jgi:glucose/arabinose dehydrogenase